MLWLHPLLLPLRPLNLHPWHSHHMTQEIMIPLLELKMTEITLPSKHVQLTMSGCQLASVICETLLTFLSISNSLVTHGFWMWWTARVLHSSGCWNSARGVKMQKTRHEQQLQRPGEPPTQTP